MRSFPADLRHGMVTLTLSASVPTFKPHECVGPVCPEASLSQSIMLFVGLYMIALGAGGIKPCVPFHPLELDQFDDTDSMERTKKGSFFNWFYFSINMGAFISGTVLVWIQDNYGWGLGFGIPTLFMGLSIGKFFIGMKIYGFQKPGGSPLTSVCQVVVAAVRKRNADSQRDLSLHELDGKTSAIEGSRKLEHTAG